MLDAQDRLLGGLYGLLIGDAVGVPYEFHRPENLPPLAQIDMVPPTGFRRAHAGMAPGTWSDDGAQALCLLASLLHREALDLDDLGARLLNWAEGGYCAVGGVVFDIGNQTSAAMNHLRRGVPAHQSGPAGERDNGNGALMRVLPLALWHRGDDAALARDAMRQGLPTHGHRRSQLCCAIICLWARYTWEGRADGFTDAVETTRSLFDPDPASKAELDLILSWPRPTGSGYVVDTLHTARAALEEPSYERVIQRAIAFGQDTDTTACVAGGIAGIRHGLSGIPARWREGLRGAEIVAPLAAGLVASRQRA